MCAFRLNSYRKKKKNKKNCVLKMLVSYRHSYCHGRLCHSVHGGGNERGFQCNLPGQC